MESYDKETPTKRPSSWFGRLVSGVVGIVVGVAATVFGITPEHVEEQKQRVENIKTHVSDAISALEEKDLEGVKVALDKAKTEAEAGVDAAKPVIENIKNTTTKDVVDAVEDTAKQK